MSSSPAPDVQRSEDWAARLTQLIETGVTLIRDKSVRPALLAATSLVVALAVTGTAVTAAILVAVGLARLFNNLVFGHRMWATFLLDGGIFVLPGVFLLWWGRRS